ncbi:MAG: ornithine cyclodeaminase family protein [Bacteroidota bacterium]
MLLLKDELLDQLLTPAQLVDAVQAAMLADEAGSHSVPQRAHINFGKNTILLMPAIGPDGFGTKVVSVMPGNPAKGLPMISGSYLLNDADTGAILAMMSTAKLTALRTGAIGGVGARILTAPDLNSFVLVGCGVQSRMLARCICAVRPIHEIICVTRGEESFLRFRDELQPILPGVTIRREADVRTAIAGTQLVVAATTSAEPVLPDDPELLEGKTYISIGSYRKDMQEFPNAVYRLAGAILIDANGIRNEVGDVINPLAKELVSSDQVFTLGSVLTKKHTVTGKTIVFKSAGYALFDLFAAKALVQAALDRGAGITFEF